MHMVSVLGGAGFIGTALCRQLEQQKIPFEIIDLKPSQTFPDQSKIGDVRDIDALKSVITGDIIINLAAVHRDDVSDRAAYYETNVHGTKTVCDVAADKGIDHIIFTSSVAVYGFAPVGTGEDGKIDPFNDYGKSKAEGEDMLRQWRNEASDSRNLTIVRPTVVFGEGNRGNVFNLLNQVASGRFIMIGSGKNRKSMAYVENVADFLLHAARNPSPYTVVNYVDDPDLDMNTLVSQIRKKLSGKSGVGFRMPYGVGLLAGYMADGVAKMSGRSLPISSVRVRKFCANTSFKSAKSKFHDFSARFSIEEGLERTLEAEFISPDPNREVFFTE
ncbi:NAD-dependent epimerase/dehydratase family protein [Ruegeria arenilitoris]|uniref:NAD-dependent epimerase/dehydratase family protein n=1 Tax=Ruegeria arenilitoris TaxID=1173585 RepID=UPI001C2CAE99|nr:NAD(P)-dependent oxidoreductase [Ruegeria arenilitoris]